MADLIYDAVLEKFTGQQFSEDFDFTGIAPESATAITSYTVTVTKTDGTNSTSTIKVSDSKSGLVVSVVLTTSSTETGYIVTVAIVANDAASTPSTMSKLLNVTSPGVYR